uniref:SH3 domain-containing protein n=1 Tax=Steinernema glaseri TaxID=37863 RepID=A0A1I8A3R7_9BILA
MYHCSMVEPTMLYHMPCRLPVVVCKQFEKDEIFEIRSAADSTFENSNDPKATSGVPLPDGRTISKLGKLTGHLWTIADWNYWI